MLRLSPSKILMYCSISGFWKLSLIPGATLSSCAVDKTHAKIATTTITRLRFTASSSLIGNCHTETSRILRQPILAIIIAIAAICNAKRRALTVVSVPVLSTQSHADVRRCSDSTLWNNLVIESASRRRTNRTGILPQSRDDTLREQGPCRRRHTPARVDST